MRAFCCAATIAASLTLGALTAVNDAQAAETRVCATPEAVASRVRQESPDAQVTRVSGVDAANLSAGISAATGAAVARDSVYLLAREPGATVIYLVQFEAGCATHHGRFPDGLVQAWIRGIAA